MFPNSPNALLVLLTVVSTYDEIGVSTNIIKSKKQVYGNARSITQAEYNTSVQINKNYDIKINIQAFLYDDSKYALYNGKVYKIERTYLNGMFLELYLTESDIELTDET